MRIVVTKTKNKKNKQTNTEIVEDIDGGMGW